MTRRGLTGVELMVALAVTGLAAVIGSATLALLTDRSAALRDESTATGHAAAVRRTIVAWLEDAHGAQSPFSGSSAAAFEPREISVCSAWVFSLQCRRGVASPLSCNVYVVHIGSVIDVQRSVQRGRDTSSPCAARACVARVLLPARREPGRIH